MSVTIGPEEPIVPANNTVLLTNKTTSQFLGDEMGLALKSDVPTKTSQLDNDSDLATNASVDEKIGGVTSSIPTKTSQLQNDSGFLDESDEQSFNSRIETSLNMANEAMVKCGEANSRIDSLSNTVGSFYATKEELDTVNRNLTTTVLDMQNELDTKATNASVDEKIGGVTSSIPTKVSQIENDSGYTTQAYVDNAIGNVLTQEEF